MPQGSTGEQELDEELNGEERLQRINREAGGRWDAGAYDFWKGLKAGPMQHALQLEWVSFCLHSVQENSGYFNVAGLGNQKQGHSFPVVMCI